MAIPPEWDRIDPLRKAVASCVAAVFANDGLRDALSTACSELLENAMKYGPCLRDGLVHVAVHETNAGITISVSHPITAAASDHVEALRGRLAWLASFASPSLAYAAALERPRGPAPDSERLEGPESGLGLARIAYESGCHLECDTSTPGVLTMRASCALSP